MAYTDIDDPSAFFQTVIYTGNATARSITFNGNSDMQPDWVWGKQRSGTDSHQVSDSVRGVSKKSNPDTNAAEGTTSTHITAFNSNGFSVGTGGGFNGNTITQVAWCWKAGTSVSGNTTGSGTYKSYSGSVNTTSGFSIIKYAGNGASGHTIPHRLSAIPKMIMVKTLGNNQWQVYHATMGNTKKLCLDDDSAQSTQSNRWNDTSPTSSVFTLGNHVSVNSNNVSYIAYCFADVKGYSKMSGYTGNNQTGNSSPFIYTGFAPTWLMVKKYSATNHWIIWDNRRSTKNGANIIDKKLYANLTNAENGAEDVSFLSNGFKFNTNTGDWNEAQNYLYMCFGQSLVGSNNTPATAK